VILPTLLIIGLVLVFSQSSQAAPAPQPRVLLSSVRSGEPAATGPAQETGQPPCQKCHPNEYAAWKDTTHAKATLDPVFQEQLAQSHNQEACLSCHTTGFDTGSGKFLSEGVTCEACHGPYKQGHPAAETMQLPMESETCRMCHETAFKDWETSKHAEKNIECFDCHMAHTQGLRTGSEEKLCSACHSDQQTQLTHSQHGINGVDCASCHMASQMKPTGNPTGVDVQMSSHSFTVPADVCNGCHSSTIHSGGRTAMAQPVAVEAAAGGVATQPAADRTQELEQQINDLQKRADTLRDVAVLGMGLTLAAGGFIGLLLGIVGMTLWHSRRP
jgi:hypothetical protein